MRHASGIITGTVRSLIVDVAMGQIPRSTERMSSCSYFVLPFKNSRLSYLRSLPTTFNLHKRSLNLDNDNLNTKCI